MGLAGTHVHLVPSAIPTRGLKQDEPLTDFESLEELVSMPEDASPVTVEVSHYSLTLLDLLQPSKFCLPGISKIAQKPAPELS